jgi:F-type H+-transporting ATPase subunit delta
MISNKLINRYAIALLEIAQEKKIDKVIFSNAADFIRICDANRNFAHLIKNPIFLGARKIAIIKQLFTGKFDEMFISFTRIVINHGREHYLKEIFLEYLKLYKTSLGIIEAEIITAVTVDNAFLEKFSGVIQKLSGFDHSELTNKVDENIIGGFILKFEDKILDASVSEKLRQLKKQNA